MTVEANKFYQDKKIMARKIAPILLILAISLSLAACDSRAVTAPPATTTRTPAGTTNLPEEISVQPIALAGPASQANAEFSGLAWFGDWLILLPQYPARFSGGSEGVLLALAKQDVLNFIDGKTMRALEPRSIPLIAPGLNAQIRGFEGFEALAVIGERIYMTVESNSGSGMLTYLVSGNIASDLSAIRLETNLLRPVPAQAAIANFSDETIVAGEDRLLTLYEANGALYNPQPKAHPFDLNLNTLEPVAFPNIEYRITDSTPIQPDGTFWAINYFFPGDSKIAPASDPLASQFGEGATHIMYPQVERLVQFRVAGETIQRVDRAPVQLKLVSADTARNWEGIALLEGRGFLLVTDQYPQTILAFVPYPMD